MKKNWMMNQNKKQILIVILFLFNISVWGQTTIYSQNFGNVTTWPANWTNDEWSVSTSSTSNTYTGASGGSNLSSSSSNSPKTVTVSNISTLNYTNVSILWGARRTYTNSITCQWSNNGSTWTTLSFNDVTNNSSWALINGGTRISLPIGANGQNNLQIKWTYDSDGITGRYRIDDFNVIATCVIPTKPSVISGSITPCQGSSQTYSVTNVLNVTYAWVLPLGWTGTSTTNSIVVIIGVNSGNIQITPSNGCGNGTTQILNVIVSPLPTLFNVTGSGSYCAGGMGIMIGLSNSTSGVTYQLKNGLINIGNSVSGTGSSISFGNQTLGTYTVIATNITTSCSTIMSGNAIVTVNTLPATPTASVTLQPTCTVATGTITITAPTAVGMTYSINYLNYISTQIFTLVISGTYTVTAKSLTGCVSLGRNVTINVQPIIPIGGILNRGQIFNLSWLPAILGTQVPCSGTVIYTWYRKLNPGDSWTQISFLSPLNDLIPYDYVWPDNGYIYGRSVTCNECTSEIISEIPDCIPPNLNPIILL